MPVPLLQAQHRSRYYLQPLPSRKPGQSHSPGARPVAQNACPHGRTALHSGTASPAAGPAVPDPPPANGSARAYPARSAGTAPPGHHAAPPCCRPAGSRTPSPSRQRTAAGSTRCRPWQCRPPCPCRCGCVSGRPPAVRASAGGSGHAPHRPSETRAPAAGAPPSRDRGCAACPDRRCGCCRFRRRTGRCDKVAAHPSGIGRSGRHARHIHPGSPPGSHAHSRPW